LGNPKDTFEKALGIVTNFAKIKKVSRLYKSAPFGFADQPPFINAAVKINTKLSPQELLLKLQEVEKTLGKKVIRANGPRVIDLDLLLYGDQIIKTKELNLPHPGILERDFVILPLLDLNSKLMHPAWGLKTLKSALGGLHEKFIRIGPEEWNYQA
jgi:2-amino-4-hydroxy-6-hydroxymethyldihydropteridine diphosphokinase